MENEKMQNMERDNNMKSDKNMQKMQCVEDLRKLDIKEVSLKTRMTTKRIQDVMECNFDKIDKTRAKGFIKILSREYKIDFSEWLAAYDAYCKEQEANLESKENKEFQNRESKSDVKENISTESAPKDTPKSAAPSQSEDAKLNIALVDSTKQDKTYIQLIIVLALLVLAFAGYFVYNNFFKDSMKSTQTQQEKPFEKNPISQNPQESDEGVESSIEENAEQNNATTTFADGIDFSQHNATNSTNDTNAFVGSENATNEAVDTNAENPIVPQTTTNPQNTEIITNATNRAEGLEVLRILPKSPLWIGIIDLDTYQKKQLSASRAYSITLDKDKLIRTGHGHFDIQGALNKKYVGGDNKYFLYTRDGGFREITKSEFLNFNRGEEW